MKTVIIEYAVIDPVTLINKIEKAFPGAMGRFTDIDEDYFELSVWVVQTLKCWKIFQQSMYKKTIDKVVKRCYN